MSAKKHIIPVFVPHLGCPFDCVFCDQRGISGIIIPPSPDDVYNQITIALQKLPHGKAVQVAFFGGSFTAVPLSFQNELLDAANCALSDAKIDGFTFKNAGIRISTRPDFIDDEIVARLISKNVTTIELGAQSMDEAVLTASGRGHTAQDVIDASKAVKNGGAALILQMMTGLPGDTTEKSLYTAREIIKLNPDGIRIYPTVIVNGTRLHELWQSGEYKEHTVEDAVELCVKFVPLFGDAGIPIIRLGLNPSDGLTAGDAVAGAYHPAFGELVRSRIYLDDMREALRAAVTEQGCNAVLSVRRGQRSAATGQHRCNIETLAYEFVLNRLKIVENEAQKHKIVVVSVDNDRDM